MILHYMIFLKNILINKIAPGVEEKKSQVLQVKNAELGTCMKMDGERMKDPTQSDSRACYVHSVQTYVCSYQETNGVVCTHPHLHLKSRPEKLCII